jgi:hypothetical protein
MNLLSSLREVDRFNADRHLSYAGTRMDEDSATRCPARQTACLLASSMSTHKTTALFRSWLDNNLSTILITPATGLA